MDMQDSSMRKQMLFYKVSIQQKPFFDTTAQYTNTMFFNTHTHRQISNSNSANRPISAKIINSSWFKEKKNLTSLSGRRLAFLLGSADKMLLVFPVGDDVLCILFPFNIAEMCISLECKCNTSENSNTLEKGLNGDFCVLKWFCENALPISHSVKGWTELSETDLCVARDGHS